MSFLNNDEQLQKKQNNIMLTKFKISFLILMISTISNQITYCLDVKHNSSSSIASDKQDDTCTQDTCLNFHKYVPHSPLIPCNRVPSEFVRCDDPLDLKGNDSAREDLGYGCSKFGGQRYEDVQFTSVNCTVLPGIECFGERLFVTEHVPCIKYTGHYFVTTLLYSILLGFLGMDRFCLGHTGTAVGKLLTLGGVGIWWLVDIVLLVTGHLTPEDGSNWMPTA